MLPNRSLPIGIILKSAIWFCLFHYVNTSCQWTLPLDFDHPYLHPYLPQLFQSQMLSASLRYNTICGYVSTERRIAGLAHRYYSYLHPYFCAHIVKVPEAPLQ